MNHPPLKAAMIGGGINSAVGRSHEIALRLDGAFDLVSGCFSRNSEINVRSAEAYQVSPTRAYASLERLLEGEGARLDAVVIATPINAHASQIAAVLNAGLTVICDKPLVTSLAECDALLARVSSESTRLFSVFNYTGYQSVREIKRRVEAGEIGKVFKIMAEMPQDSYLRLKNTNKIDAIQPWRLIDGDVPCLSLDLFAHIHSLVNFITGENPISVSARSRAISQVSAGLVDEVDALIEYQNGLLVNAWYGKVALGSRNGLKIRVYGTLGSFEWYQERPEQIIYANAIGDRMLLDRISSTSSVTPESRYNRFKAGHPAGFIEAFANYYYDIARAIHDGFLNEYTLSAEVAVQGIALSEAIERASSSRQEVRLG
ncbi:Gfo/Idh/MocA family protein [Dechloromonas sp. HYN0024]|uniref:Gfo/Idh/MocA family protein n=1 Tax=Dechloromonas sp. HYN0024 TaxID=2231055 RepID=UPI000E44DBF7|nr:Gfo/Idh/MocA family oxidoreductase [Dechloromonas sp. HYN0024]AXS80365.1 gfo/Idh/MocA family oxidoreductase [Dechloromonas sp. HYN0024]